MTLQILLPFLKPPQTSLSILQTLLSAPPTHLLLLPIFYTIFLVSYTYHVSCTALFQQLLLSLYLTSFPKPFTSCPVYIFLFFVFCFSSSNFLLPVAQFLSLVPYFLLYVLLVLESYCPSSFTLPQFPHL